MSSSARTLLAMAAFAAIVIGCSACSSAPSRPDTVPHQETPVRHGPTPDASVDPAFVIPPNTHPDAIARAYRKSARSQEAAVTVRLMEGGATVFDGTGFIDLAHRRSVLVGSTDAGKVEYRDINGLLYRAVQDPGPGSAAAQWTALDLTSGATRKSFANVPAATLAVAPPEALAYLGRLTTAVTPHNINSHGRRCDGYKAVADALNPTGPEQRVQSTVCLDRQGRITRAVMAFRQDKLLTHVEMQISDYGVVHEINPPSGSVASAP
jgi:hypothetical protein